MNINYKVSYVNKYNNQINVNLQNIEEAKSLYKTLLLDPDNKNIKFFITNQTEIEMKYDELFENKK